ncbi:MAG: NUDIX hydrolase [Gemmatimonadetes bacterium]|nr:NUDIX hydrolase [Gemmatimonadota bacterium]
MAGSEGQGGRPREWERLESEDRGDFDIFRVRSDRARSPRTGEVEEFNIAESPDGVTVIALTAAGELVMVEQFRHALRTVTMETPSGFMDEGESPVEAATRELREETGYEGEDARVIGCLELNPSWQTTRVYVVQLSNARRSADRELDEAEDIRVLTVGRERALDLVKTGGIRACVAVSALALMEWAGR